MTVKEILEKTEFGNKKYIVGIRDYKTSYLIKKELLLEMYNKAFRKNAAWRYREIKVLLDREAVVIQNNYCDFEYSYDIITRRSFEGPFSKPLKDHEKIILE